MHAKGAHRSAEREGGPVPVRERASGGQPRLNPGPPAPRLALSERTIHAKSKGRRPPFPFVPDDGIVVHVAAVYILRCADGSLYVGHTSDLQARERTHNEGRGGSFTAARRPVTLVYSESLPSLEAARAREAQLKRWSALTKEALLCGDLAALHRLSRRRRRAE